MSDFDLVGQDQSVKRTVKPLPVSIQLLGGKGALATYRIPQKAEGRNPSEG
jgi:hypothetical protein